MSSVVFPTPASSSSSSTPKKPINLLRGWPAKSLLPASSIARASQTALADPEIAYPALLYGPDPGYQPLREELAQWLNRFYKPWTPAQPEPDRITISGGASQSIACVLQSYTDPVYTRSVWMVAPCYFLACPIFLDSGFEGRLKAVPEDDEGIDLAWLEAGLKSMEEEDEGKNSRDKPVYKDPKPYRKIYKHLIYCVPSFSNPSGKTMSLRRRDGLVKLARKYDALVVCDDVYDMLQWPTATPSTLSSFPPSDLTTAILPRLADIDFSLGCSAHDPPSKHFGHAISNASFSKLSGPGMRTGWTFSTPDFAFGLSQTGSTRSGGAPSQLNAAVLCEMLRAGDLEAHIEGLLKPAYQKRHALLLEAVGRVLVPLGAVVNESSLEGSEIDESKKSVFGGYFLWMKFPDGPAAKAIAEMCQLEEELIVGFGDMFEVHGDEEAVRFGNGIRLCFAWEDEGDLVEGVERLGRVISRMRNEPGRKLVEGSRASGKGMDEFK
ncbi:pyridoxal phosphate-dependent transferase [Pseudomassariella vexata]|uniref:Pyridoxal phosphate-dependent transferase n=1 Tax=Pseudomassariella vexata TaxID=1141098 RepID=A0A1Y2DKC8_9PEZI|nr:pyridoxal phosphate-dependent transferase [Pseudomassariella vexata]ORY59727.1 pyridoxal phosphate-dependent transferase [Pseudomassariella vexata]